MFADARFEIKEIHQCFDCYRHSNEKFDSNWFALPCNGKKHDLVYAKMAGFPYWPAKVIKITGDLYDVRFFGAHHSRYEIDKRLIKPIDCDIRELNRGQTSSGLKKAMQELDEHRRLLMQNPSQFSFEAERELRERKSFTAGKRKRAGRSSSTGALTKRRRINQSASKSFNNDAGNSVNLSQEAIEQLESKQRTRGDIKKIINTIEGSSDKPIEQPGLAETPSVPASIGTLSSMAAANKRPKVGPKSVMERLAREEQEAHKTRKSPSKKTTPTKNHLTENAQTSAVKILFETPTKSPRIKAQLAREQNNAVFKIRRRIEPIQDLEEVKAVAMEVIAKEIEAWQQRIRDLNETHLTQLKQVKMQQWCINCQNEAYYYCCWNTSYCSKQCQMSHWIQDHKQNCKRLNN